MSHERHTLALIPRDGLFCNDGRGWHTSASGRGHSLDWPWPSTIRGALTTASGRVKTSTRSLSTVNWQDHHEDVVIKRLVTLRRQTLLCETAGDIWSDANRVWPVPADALWLEDDATVVQLNPSPLARGLGTLGRKMGSDAAQKAREALWVPHLDDGNKPMAAARWWRDATFVDWLLCHQVKNELLDATAPQRLEVARRIQAHIGIDPDTLAGADGVLFAHDVVETLERDHQWAIGVDVSLPQGSRPTLTRLGADGRLAFTETQESDFFAVPQKLVDAFAARPNGLRLVVVTPTLFSGGWRPDGFEHIENNQFIGRLSGISHQLVLRAAFVPRPTHISGWDLASRGAKKTDRLVPAGAVYFFERDDGQPFDQSAVTALWMAQIGGRTKDGFGCVVPGVWNSRGKHNG